MLAAPAAGEGAKFDTGADANVFGDALVVAFDAKPPPVDVGAADVAAGDVEPFAEATGPDAVPAVDAAGAN